MPSMSGLTAACASILALCALISFLMTPAAVAQGADPDAGRSADCLPSASRTQESCEPTTTVVGTESEISFSLELPPLKTAACAAIIEIAYTQKDTVASVDGTVHNTDCAVTSGEYKVLVVTRSEDSKVTTQEFLESWQHNDAQPIEFNSDYPIDANVDLIRVRAQATRCTCEAADAP
jgi:hypothetical protein